ncbi:hypothetical protein K7640_21730 [Micromonospora sp. PLK6-60]|uniref:hypothetical protein n=1 Tax=Micromonospora sp. PLK6-60 TaxID=2873383 RepID=UPI001CA63E28|nr:hypothetical protein [Micromonospora sp. PLK6-60]MBY8874452.1 hypothetical protein [Micromonospora sp. PLK6-60]
MADPPAVHSGSYVARAAGWPRWLRLLVPLALFVALVGAVVVTGARVVSAERVTVRVESCDLSGPKATQRCRGSWRLADGSVVSGGVGGDVLRPGQQVSGWAHGTSATTSLTSWLIAPVAFGLVLLAGFGGVALVWLRLRRRSRRAG